MFLKQTYLSQGFAKGIYFKAPFHCSHFLVFRMFLILKKNKFVFDDEKMLWKTPFAVTTEALTYDSPATLDSRFTHHSPSHTYTLSYRNRHIHGH